MKSQPNEYPLHPIGPFLEKVTGWASAQADILGLALVGSHARNGARADSDVDLVLITENPDHYLGTRDWIEQFGRITRQQTEPYGLVTSIRVFYETGLEVEYGITDERWTALPLDPGTRQVMDDGMRVLFERSNLLSRHQHV